MVINVNVKHLPSLRNLPVTVELSEPQGVHPGVVRTNVWGQPFSSIERDGKKAIHIDSYWAKKIQKEIEDFFSTKIKGYNVDIAITEESQSEINAAIEKCNEALEDRKLAIQKEIDATEKAFGIHLYFDMGDYSTNMERNIYLLRKATAMESFTGWKVEHAVATLWNDMIGERGAEFQADYESAQPTDGVNPVSTRIISGEIAEKWIGFSESQKFAKEEKEATDKERKQKKRESREAEEKAKIEKAMQFEFFVFGKGEILSSTSNLLLHTIGVVIGEEEMEIYTTAYANEFRKKGIKHTTSFDAKEEIKKMEGAKFNGEKKNWVVKNTQENQTALFHILKKYDTKALPYSLGLSRCWECGTYSSRLDKDGYCGC